MNDFFDEKAFLDLRAAVLKKLADAETPGLQVEFDPEEAEMAGAFVEDALSAEDAMESVTDFAVTQYANLVQQDDFVEIPTFTTLRIVRDTHEKERSDSMKAAIAMVESRFKKD